MDCWHVISMHNAQGIACCPEAWTTTGPLQASLLLAENWFHPFSKKRKVCLLKCKPCGVGRLRGGVEIYGVGKQMVDVVMATLAAQIEW